MSTPTSRATSILPVDIRRFSWVRRLVVDYVYDFDRLSEFYAGNPADPSAWRAAIARTQQHPRQRDAVADLLQAQQRQRGAPPEAVAATALLRDPRSVAVVTGQQAGAFGGPLFTLLKALSAIRLAQDVTEQHGVPAVPIFWIDAEDHDWDEVRRCTVLDQDLAPCAVDVGEPHGAHEGPVAGVRLDEQAVSALGALESCLPGTEFVPELFENLRRCYAPGTGMATAFGRWLESVLGSRGLIVFDSSDRAAKPLLAELFAREVTRAGTNALANAAGAKLESRGYHAQATPPEDTLALFHLKSGRKAIPAPGSRTSPDARDAADMAALARQSPEEFSPNVLLRPVVQDTLFPTVCYVSGPSELAYLGQLKDVYAAFGVPMPLIRLRGSATILDTNAMRFLTRHDLPVEQLRAQDEAALNALLASQLPPVVETTFEQATRAIEEQLLNVAHMVTGIDATLEGAAGSTLTRMQDDLRKLQGKVIQAAKRKDDTLRRQFTHAQAQAFPDGHPQEREVACVYFLAKYGPALLDRLSEVMPGDGGTHYVLTI